MNKLNNNNINKFREANEFTSISSSSRKASSRATLRGAGGAPTIIIGVRRRRLSSGEEEENTTTCCCWNVALSATNLNLVRAGFSSLHSFSG